MSIFDLNFYSRKKEYYRYSSDDVALAAVGISSYTISSLDRFFKDGHPDVQEFFTGGMEATKSKILGKGLEGSMKIMEFDYNDKVFKPVVGLAQILRLDPQKYKAQDYPAITETTIDSFLQMWNNVQIGTAPEKKANSYRAVAAKIQNSQNGYIEFETDITVLKTNKKIKIRLDLMNSRNNESAKTISLKGSPLITEVPKTSAGQRYAFRSTNDAAIGAYVSPVGDGINNPQNTASGPLALTYDPSTGEFQSGTQQMLVRILTDIDPANVRDFSPEELESFTNEDVYSGPDGLGFMGSFTKGEAIPVSSENGNPHLFGPDFKGACENATSEKVKVTVINRWNYSYKAGTLAVVSRMTGENGNWVLTSPGTPADAASKTLSFGNFEYQQLIIGDRDYFIYFKDGAFRKLSPSIFEKLCRSNFYWNVLSKFPYPYEVKHWPADANTSIVNLVASTISATEEDPIGYLTEKMKDQEFVNQVLRDTQQEAEDLKTIRRRNYNNLNESIPWGWSEFLYGLPINILEKNARKLQLATTLQNEPINVNSQDPLYALEVPMFWGMAFPDGYKADQVSRLRSKYPMLQDFEIYKNDPNLKELGVGATHSMPYLGNDLDSFLFYDGAKSFQDDISPENIKKTGGFFNFHSVDIFFNAIQIYSYVSLMGSIIQTRSPLFADPLNPRKPLPPYGLEPINPKRIQFSPMSINRLYAGSTLNHPNWSYLKTMGEYLSNSTMVNKILPSPTQSINFQEYGHKLNNGGFFPDYLGEAYPDGTDFDVGNRYVFIPLMLEDSLFANIPHSPPLGTAFQIIPPTIDGLRRSPAIPVLTCRSRIRTSSSGLSFTVNQFLGMSPQITITASNPPRVVALPFFAGIGWTDDPGNPGKQNSVAQWGDRNRTDDIDSLGTSALHVRVFEGWPQHQTLYCGQYFSPLHFNASAPDTLKKVHYNDDGTVVLVDDLDSDGKTRVAISSVDFRVPTNKSGVVFQKDNVVTKETLAPSSEWKWNGIRRAALLSGGGFAYYINYIGIEPSRTIIAPGEGYSSDTVFLFADGTSFQVNVDGNGKITGIKEESIVYGTQGLTAIPAENLQPSRQGGGSGAVFGNPTFKIRQRIGYDPAPKEVVPITRLTKPSNNGEKIAEGTITTTVNFSNTNKKDFDIFYFFHNDPTHYSVDKFLPFDGGFAQYAIVEVNGV